MSVQHQDILVYNAFTGNWQNASAAGPSGAPLGAVIGAPDGSAVAMVPSVGNTIQVDAGAVATIDSAVQMATGAASEQFPAFACGVVFNEGEANEQLGQLTISALGGSATGQAVLMTSASADGTIFGSIKHGGISQGMSTTYAFTTMHAMYPHAQLLQLGSGFNLVATVPGASTGEVWHNLAKSNGWTGTLNYSLVPLGAGGSVLIDATLAPGTVADGTVIGTLPANYQPTNFKRVPMACDNIKVGTNTYEGCNLYVGASGQIQIYGCNVNATYVQGCGIVPLGT